MKKSVYMLMILLTAGLYLSSCSSDDSSTNPETTTSKYFDMKAGSYWVYDYYDYNADTTKNYASHTLDSMVVTETTTLLEKTAFKTITYVKGDIETEYQKGNEYYFAFDENALWVSADFFDLGTLIPFPVGNVFPTDQWFLIADKAKGDTSWNIIPSPIEIEDVRIKDYFPDISVDLTVDLSINIVGKKASSSTIAIDGKSYNTIVFNTIIKVSIIIPNDYSPIVLSKDIAMATTYADGIGIVKREAKPDKISFPFNNASFPIDGWVSDIKAFSNN